MPDWLVVIILGVVEGITEFLPISSTGHLLLTEHGLKRWFGVPQPSDLFNVVIQSGAVLAVIVIFTERVKQLLFQWRTPQTRDYLAKLAGAFVLTAMGGLVLKKLDFKLPDSPSPVAWATLIGGVFFIGLECWLKGRRQTTEITWRIALAVGAAQLLAAIFPGLSRSGSTILVALLCGLNRSAAVEFTFLLGIPTLLAAGGLEMVGALRSPPAEGIAWGLLLLGLVVSALTAFLSVKWLLRFIQTHTFIGFGYYRVVVGGIILALVH